MATYFIDFGATNDGDGTTAAQAASPGATGAYKTLVGKTFATGDTVWVRRSSTALALSAALTLSTTSLSLIGWPKSGDTYYSTRPASGTSAGWDSDSADYFSLTTTTAANNLTTSGNSQYISRLFINSTLATSSATPLWTCSTATDQVIENCKATFSTATLGLYQGAFYSGGARPKINGLICVGSVGTGSGAATNICSIVNATQGFAKNLTVTATSGQRDSTPYNAVLAIGAASGNKALVIENITLTNSANYLTNAAPWMLYISGPVLLRDASLTGPTSTAQEGYGLYFNSGFSVNSELLNIQTSGSCGTIQFNNSVNTRLELKRWKIDFTGMSGTSQTTCPVSFGSASYGNQISITDGVLNSAAAQIYNYGSGNTFLFNYVSYTPGNILTAGTGQDYDIFSANHNRSLGAWHYENRHGTLDTSNTYRTEGTNFSFKAQITEQRYGGNRRAIPLNQKGRECGFINLASGTNTLTLYGYYKNYAGTNQAAPTLRDIGFTFDWLDNGNAWNYSSTFSDGALTSDSSTWNNDPGGTAFKIALTINSAAQQTVAVNVFVSPEYDSAGYVYIDPTIVVS